MAIMQLFKGRVRAAAAFFGCGGALGASFGPTGNISINTTPASSTGTNTLQTLASYALPANALDKVGRALYVEAWGTFLGNAQTKSVNLKIGGASITTASSTQSGGSWSLNGTVYKTGANAQSVIFTGDVGATRIACVATTDTSVDTSAITISVTATDGSANASGNITASGLVAQYFQ